MSEIQNILSKIGNAREGLPEDVFLLVSQLTPLVNVELLIKDEEKGTLLTWRHDEFYGPAWHLPGGIVRFKELASTRIKKVAKSELGATVSFDREPIEVNEIFLSLVWVKVSPYRLVLNIFLPFLRKGSINLTLK